MDTILSRILECMGPQHGAGKELADFLGINPNVITNWKNGSNRSYRKYLKQIAEHYGVAEDYLLTGERKEKAPTTESSERNVDPDIRRIERAKYIMPPHEWEYRMSVIKAALGEYYSDDYIDTDTDE